jgi:hypothetical protein
MVAEDLLFWLAPLADAPTADANLLCRRHADAMIVPRGWTLDDRRDDTPRLFKSRALGRDDTQGLKRPRHRTRPVVGTDELPRPQQLQIDGTGEIARPAEVEVADAELGVVADIAGDTDAQGQLTPVAGYQRWQPDFDSTDDLGGLLEVHSPLLARAFRGTDRPRP